MELEIPTCSIGICLVSLIFLTLVGFAYDAHAVTVITVRDEASCVALPLSAGTAEWDDSGNRCHISEEAILEINDEETLDLQVHLSSAGTIRNFGIVDIGARGSLSIHQGQLTNHGTINIRAGGSLVIADAIFHNVANAIVNNQGFFLGSSDNPRITNEGTVNNLDTGRMDATHDEGKFFNKAQGVINNHGLMRNVDQSGFVNDGTLNNYGSFNFANFLERTEASPQQGIINNFGDISLAGEFHNVAIIVNYARFNINGGFTLQDQEGILFNDGTIDNRADGVIESFGEFMNPGVIKNQGKISLYCSGFFHNTGSFTGNPINNACEGIPPEITAPADVTFSSSQNRLDLCQNMPITGISAIGDDGAGNVAANTLDNNLSTRWSRGGGGAWIKPDLGSTKVICSVDIAWYKGDQRSYFFDISVSNNGVNFKKVFTGESSGSTSSFERYEFADSVGRHVKITLSSGLSVFAFASITEIDVNGYTRLGIPAFSDNLDPSPLVQNSVPASGFPVGTTTVTWTATDLNFNRNSDTQLVRVVAGDTALPTVSISSPATGSTITGSPTGVKVNLKGTAADSGSGVQKVELKSLKSGVVVHSYQQATPSAPNNWGTWSHTLTFSQTGTYTITARATDKAGNQNWHSITVKIAFQSDTTIPTVSVTSPQNGASFSGPASVPKKISLTGIAADSGSGIQKVELKSLKDGAVVHAYQLASTSNNWSSWGKTLSFAQGGTYTITARVTDNAGNQNWHSITVNISLR